MKDSKNNSGYYNSGSYNSGDRNSGTGNSGDLNSGYYNSGSYNSGDRNSDSCNSGHYNSGSYNAGHYNSGSRNSGNDNSGYRNSGTGNSGDRNSGSYNSGDGNAGFFNTQSSTVRLFNKDSYLNIEDIRMPFINLKINEWIPECIMTKQQKIDDKDFHIKKGTLISRTYKEAWGVYWSECGQKDKQRFLDLPNFDAEIFKEITGIDVASNNCNGKVVEIDGVNYKLEEVK